MRSFFVIMFESIVSFLLNLPRFRFLNGIKQFPLKLVGAKFGKRVCMYPNLWIQPGINLNVGDDVDLALGVLITSKGGVTIGDRCLIGYRTQIISANHIIPDDYGRIHSSGHEYARVTIESDCWIGANCIILPGVTIREGSVIAAGSVVTKSTPKFSISAGIPAKVIKLREK